MSDDATIEEKQNFLREKILDKGYDTGQFVQFLIDKKGEDGADVAVWTMHDLQIVVKEFIKLNGGEVEEEPQTKNQGSFSNPQSPQQKIETQQKQPEPKSEPVPGKNEKKYTKKISMFDVMPSNKTKNQPVKQNTEQTKSQIKTQKPNEVNTQNKKPQTTTQNNNVNNNVGTKPKTTNTTSDNNKNKKTINAPAPAQNRNRSATVAVSGSESEYGIITSDSKKCKPTDKTQIGKVENIEITVSDPEKKETGFIKKTHIAYLVTTNPLNFKVRRRFSEINWFRQALLNIFPTNLIPVTPKKTKFGSDNFAEEFIQKRARGAYRFFNYLVKDPIIKDSQILYDFLFVASENDFNNKKKTYDNIKPLTEVQDFKSNDGKVNLLITGQNENYLENIKDNVNININIFKKINNSFKQLFNEMKAVVNRMEEISNYWTQLHKTSLKYFDSNTTCETYKQMGKLFKTWSKILSEQNNIVNIDIREHFKFLRKNFVAMKDLGTVTEKMKTNYQKSAKNLMNKKEELYKKNEMSEESRTRSDYGMKDVNKSKALQLMLPKETNQTITAKEMYGLYLNRSISEYERMRLLNGIWNKQIVLENVTKLMNILSKFHVCVGEINIGLETAALNNSNDNKCREKRIPLEEFYLK